MWLLENDLWLVSETTIDYRVRYEHKNCGGMITANLILDPKKIKGEEVSKALTECDKCGKIFRVRVNASIEEVN